jgi:hypothetical protein
MIFTEGRLQFDFDDDHWSHVIKFDDNQHYKKISNSVRNTKGVDFIGILNETQLVAIEVKDFRGARNSENERLSELPIEIAQKVIGTLATILSGCSTDSSSELWIEYEKLITRPDSRKSIKIIFWYESDSASAAQKTLRIRKGNVNDILKNKLSWLNCRSIVTNLSKFDSDSLKLDVKNVNP